MYVQTLIKHILCIITLYLVSPTRIQLISNHWHEKTLFAIAKIIEDSANFQTKKKSLINVCADFD